MKTAVKLTAAVVGGLLPVQSEDRQSANSFAVAKQRAKQ
jgi:hypothetical protein